jgi:hypothetical protein
LTKTYLFELSDKAFQGSEFHGVGGLNGKVYLSVKRRPLPDGINGVEPSKGGLSVRVDIPNNYGDHIDRLLPSTGEMISEYDLFMRNLKWWFDRTKEFLEDWPAMDSLEDFYLGDDLCYKNIDSKAGPIGVG